MLHKVTSVQCKSYRPYNDNKKQEAGKANMWRIKKNKHKEARQEHNHDD